MALTDTAVRKAKPRDKPYKVSDEKGLYLLVNHVGKYWRMDYIGLLSVAASTLPFPRTTKGPSFDGLFHPGGQHLFCYLSARPL